MKHLLTGLITLLLGIILITILPIENFYDLIGKCNDMVFLVLSFAFGFFISIVF